MKVKGLEKFAKERKLTVNEIADLKKYGATRRDIKHIHTSVWKNYGYRDSCHVDCEVSFQSPSH